MTKILTTVKGLLANAKPALAWIAGLHDAAKAAAVAGIVAPILAGLLGLNLSVPELAADLGAFGTLAALLQRLLGSKGPVPAPPAKPSK